MSHYESFATLKNGATVVDAQKVAEGHWVVLAKYGVEWVVWLYGDTAGNVECGRYFNSVVEAATCYGSILKGEKESIK